MQFCGLAFADDPLAWKVIQALAAVLAQKQRLAELETHLLIMGDDVRLDNDHHVFAEDHFAAFMAGGRAALNKWRVLVSSVNQIVIDTVK